REMRQMRSRARCAASLGRLQVANGSPRLGGSALAMARICWRVVASTAAGRPPLHFRSSASYPRWLNAWITSRTYPSSTCSRSTMSPTACTLVAPRVDSTGGVDGLWLVEAIRDVTDSIQSRSWVDPTLAAGGVGLEALGLVVDPVGSLAGMGAAWLIEHVRPLSQALELLAGDPDQITAHAHTWTNIATHTHACADQLATTSEQLLAGWTGQAAEAFQAHTATQAAALAGIARGATGIAEATRGAAELVAAVRILVRDLVAEA